MSVPANQQRTFLRLLARLRPYWRQDPALPARIQSLLTGRREFGSRDRRLYRELIYTTLRHLPWIEAVLDSQPDEAVRRVAWLAADMPATKLFRVAFATGSPPSGDKSELLPKWFRPHCPEIFSGDELETQLRRAPLWLRLQTDAIGESKVLAEFEARGWPYRRSDLLNTAVKVLAEADITTTDGWKEGRVEVQDLGSQMILESIGIEPGGHWLDACAGAGGKTLQLGRLLGNRGTVDAFDIRTSALDELKHRAARARQAVEILSGGATGVYDGVLVDAPCSGSGTWRRAPHLKWVTTEADIARSAGKQIALLREFSPRVRSGGRLVYATCSLSSRENEDVIATFLSEQHDFQPEPFARDFDATDRGAGLTIFPSRHNTDGFFVASLRRR